MNIFKAIRDYFRCTPMPPNATIHSEEFKEMKKATVEARIAARNITHYLTTLEQSIRK